MYGAFARTLAYANGTRFTDVGAKTVTVKYRGKRGSTTALQPVKQRNDDVQRRGYSFA